MSWDFGWRGALLSALLGACLAGPAAWSLRGWAAATERAVANTALVRAEAKLSELQASVANNVADIERVRADEQTKALQAARAQTQQLVSLQALLATSERERAKLSTEIQKDLIHAPTSDTRELGPAALRYLDRVRDEQSARHR